MDNSEKIVSSAVLEPGAGTDTAGGGAMPVFRRAGLTLYVDLALASSFFFGAFVLSWQTFSYLEPIAFKPEVWFQADIGRVERVLTDRYSGFHERSRIHPLFSLVDTPIVYGLMRVGGLDATTSIQLLIALVAGLWATLFYVCCRLLLPTTWDAILLTALGAASASFLFWATVPETFLFGSVTMLLCAMGAAIYDRRPFGSVGLGALAAISLTMTVTNFMAGVFLLLVCRPLRTAAQIAINAFFAIAILQIVQNLIFPEARGMLDLRSEARFVFDRSSGGVPDKARAVLSHSVVMPEIQTPIEFDTKNMMVSVQTSPLFSAGLWGKLGTALWGTLLIAGVVTLASRWRQAGRAVQVCALVAVAQLALHLVYGDQTFLYSLHYMPFLLLVAGQSLYGKHATIGRVLLAALVVCCAVNNALQLIEAKTLLS